MEVIARTVDEILNCKICSEISSSKYPYWCFACEKYICENCSKTHETKSPDCEGSVIYVEADIIELQRITNEANFKCIKNCGRQGMKYDEAYDHMFKCVVSLGKDKIQDLLQVVKSPVIHEWNEEMRCTRCKCVPFPPVNFCKCANFLYCSCCCAHDEVCSTCNQRIRTIEFMDIEKFDEKIFPMKITKHKCRFCHGVYGWDALAIHERICYPNAIKFEDKKDGMINSVDYYKKCNINKEEYLDLMEEITDKVHDKLIERLDKYLEESLEIEENRKSK